MGQKGVCNSTTIYLSHFSKLAKGNGAPHETVSLEGSAKIQNLVNVPPSQTL
jgi:hypothetical protein